MSISQPQPSHTTRKPRTVVRARQPRDLLAALPYVLGYHPSRSLVIAGTGGGRLGPTARLDVADVATAPTEAAGYVAELLVTAGVHHVTLAVYDDDPAEWVAEFARVLEAAGVQVVGSWQVCEHAYWPLSDPALRTPIADLEAAPISAELVLAGVSPAPRRDSLLDGLSPYPRPLQARLARSAAALEPLSDGDRRQVVRLWASLLGDSEHPAPPAPRSNAPRRPVGDRSTAILLAGLIDPSCRDVFMLATTSPLPPGEAGHVALAGGGAQAVDGWWTPGLTPPPDEERLDAAIETMSHLARAATGPALGYAWAVLGQLHWWVGDGVRANLSVERALALAPDNRLGQLVDAVLRHGMPPPWISTRRAQAEDA